MSARSRRNDNPLTPQEHRDLINWANMQHGISMRYSDVDPVRSEFYHGRSVAAGKIARAYTSGVEILSLHKPGKEREIMVMKNPSKWNVDSKGREIGEGDRVKVDARYIGGGRVGTVTELSPSGGEALVRFVKKRHTWMQPYGAGDAGWYSCSNLTITKKGEGYDMNPRQSRQRSNLVPIMEKYAMVRPPTGLERMEPAEFRFSDGVKLKGYKGNKFGYYKKFGKWYKVPNEYCRVVLGGPGGGMAVYEEEFEPPSDESEWGYNPIRKPREPQFRRSGESSAQFEHRRMRYVDRAIGYHLGKGIPIGPGKRSNPRKRNPVPKALNSVTNSILAGIGLALGFKLVSSLTDKSSDES